MNEAETLAGHRDPSLKMARRGVIEESQIKQEYSISPHHFEVHGKLVTSPILS